MLGLVFIYFCGKYFYELAIEHNKNKYLYAFLGVLSYYGSMLLYGFIYGIFLAIYDIDSLEKMESNSTMLTLILIPFGILTAVIFHKFLEKKWSSNPKKADFEVLDDVFLDNE